MIADPAEVAGAGEGAAGFFPAVTVSGKQLLGSEDVLVGRQALQ